MANITSLSFGEDFRGGNSPNAGMIETKANCGLPTKKLSNASRRKKILSNQFITMSSCLYLLINPICFSDISITNIAKRVRNQGSN
jgi:hypothetical protein